MEGIAVGEAGCCANPLARAVPILIRKLANCLQRQFNGLVSAVTFTSRIDALEDLTITGGRGILALITLGAITTHLATRTAKTPAFAVIDADILFSGGTYTIGVIGTGTTENPDTGDANVDQIRAPHLGRFTGPAGGTFSDA